MINLTSILLILTVLLFIFLIIFIVKSKNLKTQVQFLANKPPIQTVFDPIATTGNGMEVINSYLNTIFLKFINSKLIMFNEKSEIALTQLFSSLSSDEEIRTFIEGYVTLVSVNMSDDLKIFFNKYYKVMNPDGSTNETYVRYITEWCILKIRSMQAQMSLSHQSVNGGLDYSLQRDLDINSSMFLEIELNLYKSLGIISEQNEGNLNIGGKK